MSSSPVKSSSSRRFARRRRMLPADGVTVMTDSAMLSPFPKACPSSMRTQSPDPLSKSMPFESPSTQIWP